MAKRVVKNSAGPGKGEEGRPQGLFLVTGLLLMLAGLLAVISYPLHLLFGADPLGFIPHGEASGLSYYMTSTLGAVAIAWGSALYLAARSEAGRKVMALPSAIGFLLLALMRLLTLPFEVYVFPFFSSEAMSTAMTIAEFVIFGSLALSFVRLHSQAGVEANAAVGSSTVRVLPVQDAGGSTPEEEQISAVRR